MQASPARPVASIVGTRQTPSTSISAALAKSPMRQSQGQAQATIRTLRDPLQAVGAQPTSTLTNAGSTSDLGSRHGNSHSRQQSAGSSTAAPAPINGMSNGSRSSARPPQGMRPSSAQSVQSSASATAPSRSLPSQSGQVSQAKPDLRRWTDEDLRRQIQLLEKGLKSASSGGTGARISSKSPMGLAVGSGSVAASANVVSGSAGGTRSSSPIPPESTSNSGVPGQVEDKHLKQSLSPATGDTFVPDKLEEELSIKERQVVQLRAQIARREKQLSSRQRMVVDGSELEHPDPERTGPPSLGSGATALGSANAVTGNPVSLNNLTSSSLGHGERTAGGSTAGANTPTVASTPGGRETAQLEAELAWIVRQMEGHRRQISEHQQKLTTLEKRHADIISSLSAHGFGGGRSPASIAAERLEFEEGASGYDAIQQRLGLHKELLEAACMDRRETGSGFDDAMNMSMCSSTLSGSNKRMLQFVPGRGSRPTSAGSGTSAGSREVGSMTGSGVGSAIGIRSARGSIASQFGTKIRNTGSACSSITSPSMAPASGSRHKPLQTELSDCSVPGAAGLSGPPSEGGDGFSAASWTGGEPSRSFGKSYEAERIVYLLTQFGMKRPLRVPFVPLDAALDGEGRPYLHGALEVRLCLSEDGNRLMVRVGSGPSGVGGRLFEIEEFVNRAEAIEARRSHRPTPIAEDSVPQMEPVPTVAVHGSDLASPRFSGLTASEPPETSALMASILGRGADDGGSSLPWKKLFKSHWGA